MRGPGIGVFIRVIRKTLFATFTCILAIELRCLVSRGYGGNHDRSNERTDNRNWVFRSDGIGAVAGAITAVQLTESQASMTDGESLSKLAVLLGSLVSGKIFIEWMNSLESTHREMSDIYDVNGVIKGLSKTTIRQLPVFVYQSSNNIETWDESSCSICLREPKDGELVRKLPKCGYFFLMKCTDEWLIRQGPCPM